MSKQTTTWALGLVGSLVLLVAGNCTSSRFELLEHRARALETEQDVQAGAVDALRITLARIEQKLDDVADRVERVERKLDEPKGKRK